MKKGGPPPPRPTQFDSPRTLRSTSIPNKQQMADALEKVQASPSPSPSSSSQPKQVSNNNKNPRLNNLTVHEKPKALGVTSQSPKATKAPSRTIRGWTGDEVRLLAAQLKKRVPVKDLEIPGRTEGQIKRMAPIIRPIADDILSGINTSLGDTDEGEVEIDQEVNDTMERHEDDFQSVWESFDDDLDNPPLHCPTTSSQPSSSSSSSSRPPSSSSSPLPELPSILRPFIFEMVHEMANSLALVFFKSLFELEIEALDVEGNRTDKLKFSFTNKAPSTNLLDPSQGKKILDGYRYVLDKPSDVSEVFQLTLPRTVLVDHTIIKKSIPFTPQNTTEETCGKKSLEIRIFRLPQSNFHSQTDKSFFI